MTDSRDFVLSINEGNKISTLEVYSDLTLDEITKQVRSSDWIEFCMDPGGGQYMTYRTCKIDGILQVS